LLLVKRQLSTFHFSTFSDSVAQHWADLLSFSRLLGKKTNHYGKTIGLIAPDTIPNNTTKCQDFLIHRHQGLLTVQEVSRETKKVSPMFN